MKRFRNLLINWAPLLAASLTTTAWAANGPVLLIGDGAESHAAPGSYAGLLKKVVNNASNGQVGILAMGVDVGSDAADWLLDVAALLPSSPSVAFINDSTILAFGLSGYGAIYVPSDEETVAGGITQAESDFMAMRADDIATFINNGGGLFSLSQANLENAYAYLSSFAAVTSTSASYDDVSATPTGLLLGITDGNLDGCCWGTVFSTFPESLAVLATANGGGVDGSAAVLGAFVQIGFGDPVLTPAAGEAKIQALGDLDGNGFIDVGATIPNEDPLVAGQVQFFFNQGNAEGSAWAGLAAGDPITVGLDPSGIAVGLLDDDLVLDAVVTNAVGNSVTLLFNNGDGTFDTPVTIENVGNRPSAVTTQDFNFDFVTDFAVTLQEDETVIVFLNDPENPGSFTQVGGAASGGGFGFGPVALLSDDFDNNKCPDLTGGGNPGHVFVQLGLGDGTFSAPVVYDVGLDATDVATGDVNVDGNVDILAANTGEASIAVLLGDGLGNFAPAPDIAVGQTPTSVDLVDLDGDFARDMAVTATDPQLGPVVQVLENLAGAEGGVSFGDLASFSVGADPNSVGNGDFNADGLFDLVTVNGDQGGGGSVSVLLNQPAPILSELFASLDIKPAGCPNPLNPTSHGVLPVALVGTDSLSVTDVDFSTLLMVRADGVGGSVAPIGDDDGDDNTAMSMLLTPGAEQVSAGGPELEDVATPFTGELCDCHDLGPDGILDLKMKFKTDELVEALELDDVPNGSLVELTITGGMTTGASFEASDCVWIVPPSAAPGLLLVNASIPGVYIDVSPPDEILDDAGYADFARSYTDGTVVTLTAPASYNGATFFGWTFNGNQGAAGGPGQSVIPTQSINVTVTGDVLSVEAVYIQFFPKF